MSLSSAEITAPRSRELGHEQSTTRPARRIPWRAAGRHAVLILLCCWILFPLVIVVINSTKSRVDSIHRTILPNEFVSPIWASYEWVWTSFTLDNIFFRTYWNSIFVTTLTIVAGTISAVLAGYALSHLSTPGKTIFLLILVSSLFLPIQITSMIGIFRLHRDLGLIDETWALMLPYVAASTAVSILVMRAVFQMISKEIPDSARIDGGSSLRILAGIMLPMGRNGVILVVIINFMYAWSEFVLASVLMNDQESRTLAVLMGGGGYGAGVSARFIVAIVPGVVVLIFAQRWFAKALQDGAFKG
ncbi:MAG: carbohydrate ABC transporter permease [Thermomicrobiales bacterium]|nr:carbohydrate ABC transporter permease [Thermomicrobiales bacterium]MCO5220865.1 carbohydrate ABC transporter permease [Thermomicrobiales bacterium]